MKKILLLLILITCVFVTSCNAKGNKNDVPNSDGIPFEYYSTFESENEIYKLYIIKDPLLYTNEFINEMFLLNYEYKTFKKENTNNWILNYHKEYHYIVDNNLNQEFLKSFNVAILETIAIYEESLGITLDLYEDGFIFNSEYKIEQSKEFSELYVVDLFIPYRVINNTTNQTYLINVPMKTFLGYRNNNQVELYYSDNKIETIDYNIFISLTNINNKN